MATDFLKFSYQSNQIEKLKILSTKSFSQHLSILEKARGCKSFFKFLFTNLSFVKFSPESNQSKACKAFLKIFDHFSFKSLLNSETIFTRKQLIKRSKSFSENYWPLLIQKLIKFLNNFHSKSFFKNSVSIFINKPKSFVQRS